MLPTGGTARFSSPLGVYDFVKRTSIIEVTAGAGCAAARARRSSDLARQRRSRRATASGRRGDDSSEGEQLSGHEVANEESGPGEAPAGPHGRLAGRRSAACRRGEARDVGDQRFARESNLDGVRASAEHRRPASRSSITCSRRFARHSAIDLDVSARGDTHIDDHHTVEDVGLAIGAGARRRARRQGRIYRFGHFEVPLDEALVAVTVDLSGRPFLVYNVKLRHQRVGTFDVESGGRLLSGADERGEDEPAHQRALRAQSAPHHRSDLQGPRAGAAGMAVRARPAGAATCRRPRDRSGIDRMIAVVDYGVGNLRSVAKALERVGAEVRVTSDAARIDAGRRRRAARRRRVRRAAWRTCAPPASRPACATRRRPGSPFSASASACRSCSRRARSSGRCAGSGSCPGACGASSHGSPALKVPHMGWNQLAVRRRAPASRRHRDGAHVYFVHSYYVDAADPSIVATTTTYGVRRSSRACGATTCSRRSSTPRRARRRASGILANFVAPRRDGRRAYVGVDADPSRPSTSAAASCVRLVQGDYARETVFGDDPAAMARRWLARRRDARSTSSISTARAQGAATNRGCRERRLCAVAAMRRRVRASTTELGGGIRDLGSRRVLARGRPRSRDPRHGGGARAELRRERGASACPAACGSGIDARGGKVAVRRLARTRPSVDAIDLARGHADARRRRHRLHRHRPRRHRQGRQRRGDRARWPRQLRIPVVASGGVHSREDVARLREVGGKRNRRA